MSPLYLVFYFPTESLSDYLEIYFKSSKWYKFMYMNGNSGARSDRFAIKDKDFFEMKIKMPHSKDEMNKIYKLNTLLHKLLTLYERKIELLSQVKRYFLKNLFAEKDYPNLRFKGFTSPWEQRKIKDYASYRRGSFPQPYGKKEWYDGKDSMPFVQVVDVKENLRLADYTKQRISKLAQLQSVFVPTGKVLVTVQGSIGRVAITQYPSYIDRTLIVFEKYDTRTDKYFWAYTLQRKFDIEKRI